MKIRPIAAADFGEWRRMRDLLWPGQTEKDMRLWQARSDATVIVAERDDGTLGAFAEFGERSIGESCETSPVGYVEGWWVDPDLRGKGIGRLLIDAGERWARGRGYRELGSDTEPENSASQAAHLKLGFEEVARLVVFRKVL